MMSKTKISGGVVHEIPEDMRSAIIFSASEVYAAWEDITPLARNEWICWVTSAKKAETRSKRMTQMVENLADGKRRPCCWPGCPHRL